MNVHVFPTIDRIRERHAAGDYTAPDNSFQQELRRIANEIAALEGPNGERCRTMLFTHEGDTYGFEIETSPPKPRGMTR